MDFARFSLLIILVGFSKCVSGSDVMPISGSTNLTIVTIFAYDKVQHQMPWHIRGYVLGFNELKNALSPNITVTQRFVWKKGISACADVQSLVISWAAEEYYAASRKGQAVVFCSPELNTLYLTTLGSPILTQTNYPTVVSMSYRQQQSFAEFFLKFFEHFSWKTSLWLCDQDQTVSAYGSATCSTTGKQIQSDSRFVTYIIDFNSGQNWNTSYLLQQNANLARIVVLSATAAVVRKIMIAAATMELTNGNYVFITIQDLPNAFDDWKQGDKSDITVAKAFRTLFVIAVDGPFTKETMSSFEKRLKNVDNDTLIQGYLREKVLNQTTVFDKSKPYNLVNYQTFIALQQVLSLALQNGVSLKDGRALAALFRNKNFTSEYSDFFVNDDALRVPPMVVQEFNTSAETFMKVILGIVKPDGFVITEVNGTVIDWGGNRLTPPPDEPECGFTGTKMICIRPWLSGKTLVGICVGVGIVLLSGLILFLAAIFRWTTQNPSSWELDVAKLCFTEFSEEKNHSEPPCYKEKQQPGYAMYSEMLVHAKALPTARSVQSKPSAKLRRLLYQVKELNSHLNINQFIGVCRSERRIYLVSGWCGKGSLHSFLNSQSEFTGNPGMQMSFIWDLITGLNFIHASSLFRHGHLTSLACCIDAHFTLKICKLAYDRICTVVHGPSRVFGDDINHRFWSAPETHDSELVRSQKSDIYSLAVIMAEILLGHDTYAIQQGLSSHDFISLVKGKRVKCTFQPASLLDLMYTCWDDHAFARPSIKQVSRKYTEIAGGYPSNVTEDLLQRLQRYGEVLEDAVVERIDALRLEQANVDRLLCQVLPQHIVKELRAGRPIEAEFYASVTICFTSFDGFSEFTRFSSPGTVVQFLNMMVEEFEETIEAMDVYRVEISTDSHVLASGLPLRNGNLHAAEICRTVLLLLHYYSTKDWTDRNPHLRLKTGVHTGKIVTAVAGVTLPKYALFGDTINTASRMMSTGTGSKLHVSVQTKALLIGCPEFNCVERGLIEVKGKGTMCTFWVEKAKTPM